MAKIAIGKQVTIKPGSKVRRAGVTSTRKVASTVTVRKIENVKKSGKTRVYWKSHGVLASTTL